MDVYDKANGKGKPRNDSLKAGSTVELRKENGTHWCNVQGEAVPGGPGWIWCGIGDDGKDYKLIKMGGTDPLINGLVAYVKRSRRISIVLSVTLLVALVLSLTLGLRVLSAENSAGRTNATSVPLTSPSLRACRRTRAAALRTG